MKKIVKGISYLCYRIMRWLVWLFCPAMPVDRLENLPKEPCIVVANHCHMYGPICGELYFPGKRKIWCAHQMMYLKEVPAYSFQDFWSGRPKWTRWFYRILSYIIALPAVCIFKNANTIPVFRDNRLITTFKKTISALEDNANVIVFPECYDPHNNIIYRFQDRFIDVAKLYYKRTGKEVSFVPMYIAPMLKKAYLGKPIRFNAETPMEEERKRIYCYLMEQVTDIAVKLPRHTVVPYPNVSKKNYPTNIPDEENVNEKTCR